MSSSSPLERHPHTATEEERKWRYNTVSFDDVEDIERYAPGGFHPVHLGDAFAEERYRVVHKLGFGGFSTVWLARDEIEQSYVSLKILVADASNSCNELHIHDHLNENSIVHSGSSHTIRLLDHFTIEGPNGSHVALVYELAGPSLRPLYGRGGQPGGHRRLQGSLARKIASQASQALAYLHDSGVVHGDITSANLLFRLANIDEWSQEDVHSHLGEPLKEPIFVASENQAADLKSAPEYVVESAQLWSLDVRSFLEDIVLTDFGISFKSATPPADGIGTPVGYSAPELIFDHKSGM